MKRNHKNIINTAASTGLNGLDQNQTTRLNNHQSKQILEQPMLNKEGDRTSDGKINLNNHQTKLVLDGDKKATKSLHFKNAAAIWLDMRDAKKELMDTDSRPKEIDKYLS